MRILRDILQDSANTRSRSILVFVPRTSIVPDHLFEIRKLFREKSESINDLDILIHSGGGDIHAAYQISELANLKFSNIQAIIPLYAKSAATLLCLGMKKIIMGEIAQLGPLDAQVLEKHAGSIGYVPALNSFKALDQLRNFSLETIDGVVRLIMRSAEFELDEALKHSLEFAAKVSLPLFQQFNSEKLGQYGQSLSIGLEYGKRLLMRYGGFTDSEATSIVTKLIWGYPSHDYVLNHQDLKDLGLPVSLPDDKDYPNMEEIADSLFHYIRQTKVPIVELITPIQAVPAVASLPEEEVFNYETNNIHG